MTLREAEVLASVFLTADGGYCYSCTRGLCIEANRHRLGFWWEIIGSTGSGSDRVMVHEGFAPAEMMED